MEAPSFSPNIEQEGYTLTRGWKDREWPWEHAHCSSQTARLKVNHYHSVATQIIPMEAIKTQNCERKKRPQERAIEKRSEWGRKVNFKEIYRDEQETNQQDQLWERALRQQAEGRSETSKGVLNCFCTSLKPHIHNGRSNMLTYSLVVIVLSNIPNFSYVDKLQRNWIFSIKRRQERERCSAKRRELFTCYAWWSTGKIFRYHLVRYRSKQSSTALAKPSLGLLGAQNRVFEPNSKSFRNQCVTITQLRNLASKTWLHFPRSPKRCNYCQVRSFSMR